MKSISTIGFIIAFSSQNESAEKVASHTTYLRYLVLVSDLNGILSRPTQSIIGGSVSEPHTCGVNRKLAIQYMFNLAFLSDLKPHSNVYPTQPRLSHTTGGCPVVPRVLGKKGGERANNSQ